MRIINGELSKTGRNLARSAAALLAVTAATAQARAQPVSVELRPTPIEAAAAQLESRIKHRRPVSCDSSRDVYWSRPSIKTDRRGRGVETREWDYQTALPLIAVVNGVKRYFALTLETPGALDEVAVMPIPRSNLTVDSITAPYYNNGLQPSTSCLVEIGDGGRAVSLIGRFCQDGNTPPASPIIRLVGQTIVYDKKTVLGGPPVLPSMRPSC
ncbi:hypothetical protein HYW35_04235 [Candidatus Saccharibacteria bacterium]|nr:hypothetical protein [Candidatus Saccharibacteria bacterium]